MFLSIPDRPTGRAISWVAWDVAGCENAPRSEALGCIYLIHAGVSLLKPRPICPGCCQEFPQAEQRPRFVVALLVETDFSLEQVSAAAYKYLNSICIKNKQWKGDGIRYDRSLC